MPATPQSDCQAVAVVAHPLEAQVLVLIGQDTEALQGTGPFGHLENRGTDAYAEHPDFACSSEWACLAWETHFAIAEYWGRERCEDAKVSPEQRAQECYYLIYDRLLAR